MTERQPAIGNMTCKVCDTKATAYEIIPSVVEDNEGILYSSCDEHWREHDEMNVKHTKEE